MKIQSLKSLVATLVSYDFLLRTFVVLASLEFCILVFHPIYLLSKDLSSLVFLIPAVVASYLLGKKFSSIFLIIIFWLNIYLLAAFGFTLSFWVLGVSYSLIILFSFVIGRFSSVRLSTEEDFLVDSINNAEKFEREIDEERESVGKKVEEETKALEEERSRLEAAINSLNVGFIITDPSNEIVNMNSTAKRLLCLTEEPNTNARGVILDPLAFNLKCDLDTISRQLEGKFDLKKNLETSFKERKLVDVGNIDFRDVVLHIFMSPIVMFKDSALKVIGTVILVEDITKEKVLERSRDEFFSIASHELRTPLTSIKGNTTIIKKYYAAKLKDDKDLREMIDDIHSSSVRLIEIVNDFLDTSRLEQGRISFNKTEFDFKDLTDEVIKELTSLAEQKKLYLKLNIESKKLVVLADRDRTKQVLINLIGNSLKFTESGGVVIKLEGANDILKILVSDTGRGIETKNQNLLFHKFQQASSSLLTRDTAKGTGLGLYISKLMIEGMGGTIGLEESLPGEGTTFMFTLPLANQKEKLASGKN